LNSHSIATAKRVEAPPISRDNQVDKEFIASVNILIKAINERDLESFGNRLNIAELAIRVAEFQVANPSERKRFVAEYERRKTNFIESIFRNLEKSDTQAKFLKTVSDTSGPRALVRLNMGDTGYDYWELELKLADDGVYKLVDWYQYTTGQLISTSVGAITNLMSKPDQGLLAKLFGGRKFDENIYAIFQNISTAMKSANYKDAMSEFEKLPEDVKTSRIMCSVGINIANISGDEALYRRMLARLDKYFANDPSAAFSLLDYHIYQQDYDKALKSIDAIEQRVGNDALIYLLKANIYLLKNNYKKAVELANQAITTEPDFEDAYHALSLSYVKQKRYKDAIEIFNIMADQFGYAFTRGNFEDNEEFKEFVKSREFNKWIK